MIGLLGSAHYGERMAMDWLDAARYADTNGYQNDFARTMWPWRDWVIAAFNRNEPFDQFVVDQIAGDLVPGSSRAQKVATGFNRNNRTVTEAGSIDEEWRIENAVDRVETTATVFLGLTMGCARCHDHKYDPITQKEFYQFLGFFNSINEKGVYTETRGNVPPLVPVPGPEHERELKRLDEALAQATAARTAAEKALGENQARWERDRQAGPEPAESRDWAVRCGLDGDLHFQGPAGETIAGAWRGKQPPSWCDGPRGQALRLDGGESSFVELERGVSLDRTDRFSYGGWVRPTGDGACLSKMNDQDGYRGYDLLIENGRVVVHLVHAWPGDALKVATRATVPRDAWTHVFVTHDGSGKASGLKVFLERQARGARGPERLAEEARSSPASRSGWASGPRRCRFAATSPISGSIAGRSLLTMSASSRRGPCSPWRGCPLPRDRRPRPSSLLAISRSKWISPGARRRSVWRSFASRRRSWKGGSRP